MEVGHTTAHSLELQKNLAIVDSLRDAFANIDNDNDFTEEMSKCIPQFVVIGMQSMGKSSVLERLSMIQFPRNSTICTRAPILLCLRRGPSVPPVVSVRGPGGLHQDFTNPDTTACIEEAHGFAIESCKGLISKDYVVKIDIQSPTSANLNLLDLPGCFSPGSGEEEDAELVKELCKTYAEMENTLVLHVMAIDHDYGNISTKLMISDLKQDKVITVFTMADRLAAEKREKERNQRLQEFLNKTKDTPRFAIFGQAEGDEDEVQALENLRLFCVEDGVGIGARKLRICLERKISDLMFEAFPRIERELQNKLDYIETWLRENSEREPHAVIQRLGGISNEKMRDLEGNLAVRLRHLWEEMDSNIKKLRFHAANGSVDFEYYPVSPDSLQVNDDVFIYREDSQEASPEYIRVTVVDTGSPTRVRYHSDEGASTSFTVPPGNICARIDTSLLEEVVSIIERRGLVNVEFVATQDILEIYMTRFADAYERELLRVTKEAHTVAQESIKLFFREVKDSAPASSWEVLKGLQNDILTALRALHRDSKSFVQEQMVYWCKSPVYTTNDHYLRQNLHTFEDASDEIDLLDGRMDAALKVIAQMNGMRKVKVKTIIDAAAGEFTRIFYTKLKDAVANALGNAQQYSARVAEPSNITEMRNTYSNRRVILAEALRCLEQRFLN